MSLKKMVKVFDDTLSRVLAYIVKRDDNKYVTPIVEYGYTHFMNKVKII